eukprot:TRINITY_DN4036_c0_g1_i1.p1 TRINITY_DN4036_c0_g1~~TRINITY_DN4036_c0_g1_i1.p1  ORF type:complete len:1747 (-),score=472.23 TRINITY_DN4036_c0_g1_i1:17-5257(-)
MDEHMCRSAQEDEVAALRAIFLDDFVPVTSSSSSPSATPTPAPPAKTSLRTSLRSSQGMPFSPTFKIKLVPYLNSENNHSMVSLFISLPPMYPAVAPIFELQKGKGLGLFELKELESIIAKFIEKEKGRELIYDLTELVKEFLVQHNREPLSLYAEMVHRQQALEPKSPPSPSIIRTPRALELSDDLVYLGSSASPLDDAPSYGSPLAREYPSRQGAGMDEGKMASVSAPPIRWTRGRMLGTDASGAQVYECTNTDTDRRMVMKEVRMDSSGLSESSDQMDEDTQARIAKLQHEVQKMKELRNANLVRYLGFEHDGSIVRIFEEDTGGKTIKKRLRDGERFDEGQLRRCAQQILVGLHYLHSHRLAHRNLHTHQIISMPPVGGSDSSMLILKLSSYGGYARRLSDYFYPIPATRAKNQQFWGVIPGDLNPATERQHARKDDIYMLGTVLYCMATGMSDVDEVPAKMPEFLSRTARDFMTLCLKREPSERPEAAPLMKHPFLSPSIAPSPLLTIPYPSIPSHSTYSTPSSSESSDVSVVPSILSRSHMHLHVPQFAASTASSSSSSASTTSFSSNSPSAPTSLNASLSIAPSSISSSLSHTASSVPDSPQPSRARAQSPPSPVFPSSSPPVGRNQRPFYSRYKNDFEELEVLGRGGFGVVVKARNRLDGRFYAIKKIRSSSSGQTLTQRMLREVTTLSRLHHRYVVRYYQAWIEKVDETTTEDVGTALSDEEGSYSDDDSDVEDLEDLEDEFATDQSDQSDWFDPNSSLSRGMSSSALSLGGRLPRSRRKRRTRAHSKAGGSEDTDDDDEIGGYSASTKSYGKAEFTADEEEEEGEEEDDDTDATISIAPSTSHTPKTSHPVVREPQILYIQMDYCTRKTLRTVIDEGLHDEDEIWRLARQIVEGLAHIHQQGIIHRDLKPANIFIDDSDDVKIGDFGLATTGSDGTGVVATSTKDARGRLRESLGSMTSGVGTYFYCSPELLLKTTKHYGSKVDIYSLGIIFFEMWQPFGTEMERADALRTIRQQGKFPPGFEARRPNEAQLIRTLLQTDPELRPDTQDLLDSDLIPRRMEEEILKEALKSISNHSTSLFSFLLQQLFGHQPDTHIINTYHYSATVARQTLASSIAVVRERTFSRAASIFKTHGAISLDAPLLLPKIEQFVQQHGTGKVACLLDEAGTPVTLPFDLTLPWARFVAQHELVNMKRYSFSKVYRRIIGGVAPRELYECDFDITGLPPYKSIHDAEVVKVMCEVMDEFHAELGGYMVRVARFDLLNAVLEACGVTSMHYAATCMTLARLFQGTWADTASILRQTLPSKTVDKLAEYFSEKVPASSADVLDRIERLLSKNHTARQALSEIREFFSYVHTLGMTNKVYFDLSLIYNHGYYDGVVFQTLLDNRDVVMAGGRYDSLVRRFRADGDLQGPSQVGAVGVNIAIEIIVAGVMGYEQRKAKSKGGGMLRPSETEVMVCALDAPMLNEKLEMVSRFWLHKIKADYMSFEPQSMDELIHYAREKGVVWVVIIKERAFRIHGTVRVKTIDLRGAPETQVPKKDLLEFILKAKRQRESGGTGTGSGSINVSPNSSSSSVPSSSTHHGHYRDDPSSLPSPLGSSSGEESSGSGSLSGSGGIMPQFDVTVLQDDLRGRQVTSNKKMQTYSNAQSEVSKFLRTFSSQHSNVKVICTDLPIAICREVATSFDPGVDTRERDLVLSRHSKAKDKILQLRTALAKWKAHHYVFVYSHTENRFTLVTM